MRLPVLCPVHLYSKVLELCSHFYINAHGLRLLLYNITDVGAAAVYSSSAASQQLGNTICSMLHVPSRACVVLDALPMHCFDEFF